MYENNLEQQILNLVKSLDEKSYNYKIDSLLKSGVNPNTLDPDLGNISVIMIAISMYNIKIVEKLIEYGADINLENNVLSRCVIAGFPQAFELILNHKSISDKSIEFAFFISLLREDRFDFTKRLFETKKEICLKARNAQGLNILEFAQKVNNKKAVEILSDSYF
ncbi:MAG: hypothetical protein U0354_02690 [Candidatus Sericytochromatia bacterium]